MKFSARALARSLIYLLLLLIVTLTVVSFLPAPILQRLVLLWQSPPADLTPPPPTILAPRRPLPAAPVGFQEWALYEGNPYRPVGSGFLLRLESGTVVGVTTAHSLGSLADPASVPTRVAFGINGREGFVIEFYMLHGKPGVARTGDDMTVDYVLLKTYGQVDPALVLDADPRGSPQEGERVSLYFGVEGGGTPAIVQGTVQSAGPESVWVYMDPMPYPGGMSGSPMVSNHTGQVVGMAIATSPRGDRYLIGIHPIGSIVAKAMAAMEFPRLADYP